MTGQATVDIFVPTAYIDGDGTNGIPFTIDLPVTLANAMLNFEFYLAGAPVTTGISGNLAITGKYKNGRTRNITSVNLATSDYFLVIGVYSQLILTASNLVGCDTVKITALQNVNIMPMSTGGGGAGGATSLVVTSPDGSVIQVSPSSYDSNTQTLSIELEATGSGAGVVTGNGVTAIPTYAAVYRVPNTTTYALAKADNPVTGKVFGICSLGTATPNTPITVQYGEIITNPAWNWIPDGNVFVSDTVAGGLTQTAPATIYLVGRAISPTQILIRTAWAG